MLAAISLYLRVLNTRFLQVLLLALPLYLSSVPLLAQQKWQVGASVSSGSDFKDLSSRERNSLGELGATLKKDGDKFSISGSLNASSNHRKETSGGSSKDISGEEVIGMTEDLGSKSSATKSIGTQWDASWKLNARNNLDVHYNVSYTRDEPSKVDKHVTLVDLALLAELGQLMPDLFSVTKQDTRTHKTNQNLSAFWRHLFAKDGRELNTSLLFRLDTDRTKDRWQVGEMNHDFEPISERTYRLTPRKNDYDFLLSGQYLDKSFLDIPGLDAEMKFSLKLGTNKDHLRAANYYDGQWVDSLLYRADFRFHTITVSPLFHLTYKLGGWETNLSYTPEYYTSKLSDQDNEGSFKGGLISHLISFSTGFCFSDRHRLSVSYDRSISRPDYMQICWFVRPGDYHEEVVEGNPYLKPSIKNQMNLLYDVGKGNLTGTVGVGYTIDTQKMEKTFIPMTRMGFGPRHFTWINAGKGETLTFSASVNWKFHGLTLDAGGNLNYFHGLDVEDVSTYSSDYSLYGNASYALNTWQFTFKSHYESDIKRTYTSRTSVVGCDVRVDKTLGQFKVYFEGRNLLDRSITTTTISLDGSSIRSEISTPNKRLFVAGVSWNL